MVDGAGSTEYTNGRVCACDGAASRATMAAAQPKCRGTMDGIATLGQSCQKDVIRVAVVQMTEPRQGKRAHADITHCIRVAGSQCSSALPPSKRHISNHVVV